MLRVGIDKKRLRATLRSERRHAKPRAFMPR